MSENKHKLIFSKIKLNNDPKYLLLLLWVYIPGVLEVRHLEDNSYSIKV